ncbi:hypothetical protein DOMOVOI_00440 [Brevundimonas phage vB_BpoS-Domovoi]|uniref:Uncharacterized protein n=1 Tax=Brevundimonas phage vB_BpoS-Domovoi TaxID=2948598 RepID=A0A9E7MQF7_9CAUD|nr:hypothetical protein DOMOVOI_00440 [Brevundimonas phage vB_BpoS-Domovoi]
MIEPSFVIASDFAEPKRNTCVSYMYRDAANYKEHLEVVLDGAMSLEQACAIDALLTGDGEDFLPGLVGLEAADWSSDGAGGHYKDDHPWHELTRIEPTDAEANGPTVAQFIAAMEAADNQQWIPGHATKWKLMTDGKRARYYKTYLGAFNKASVEAIPYKIIPPLSEIFAD